MKIGLSDKLILQGSVYLTISKIFFMLSGYVMIFTLSYLLKPEVYGIYSSITSVLAIINTIIINGSMLTVSKIVANQKNKDEEILQQSLIFQFIVGVLISSIYFIMSPWIANFLSDPKLTLLFQLSSLIVFCYSIYSIFAGYLNGKKKFYFQAVLDAFFSFLKLFFTILFAFFAIYFTKFFLFDNFDKAYFVLLGSAIASIFIVCLLLILMRRFKYQSASNDDINKNFINYIKLLFPTAILAFLITFILQLDLLLVKKFEPLAITGIYSLSIQIARIPYYLVTGIIFAIFPIVAELSSRKKQSEILERVRSLVKYYLITMCFIAAFVSANAYTVFTLFFPKDYLMGKDVLSVYIFSVLFFAVFYILIIAYIACGHSKFACLMAFLLLCFDYIAYSIVIPNFGIIGASFASLLSNIIALTIISIIFFKDFGTIINLKTAILILTSSIIIYALSLSINGNGYIPFILEILFCIGIYALLLKLFSKLKFI